MTAPDWTTFSDADLTAEASAIQREFDRRMVLRDTPEQIFYSVERYLEAGGSIDDLALERPVSEGTANA